MPTPCASNVPSRCRTEGHLWHHGGNDIRSQQLALGRLHRVNTLCDELAFSHQVPLRNVNLVMVHMLSNARHTAELKVIFGTMEDNDIHFQQLGPEQTAQSENNE